jgi:hypothetical protein
MARQIGQVWRGSKNHEMRHSVWNSWPQMFSFIVSAESTLAFSMLDEALVEKSGCRVVMAALMAVMTMAGSGFDGIWSAERQIALQFSSADS